MAIDMVHATAESFSDYVGDSFNVHTDDGVITLTLDNIKMFNEKNIRDNHLEIEGVVYPPRAPFALTFTGPLNPVLPQKIYHLEHEKTGRIDLFLSPFLQETKTTLYESVFN